MEDFKKVKKYSIGDDGDNLLSQWTSDQTVEMSSGETLQEKANSIDKDISDEITRAKKAESDLDNKKIDKTMVATNETLGLVKSGTDITVDDDGNVSVNDNSHKHLLSNISDLAITAEELNVLDGITASTDELNKLHNTTAITEDFNKLHEITASAEELNILDGITISTEELNNISGINGNIQEQLNSKASLESPVLTGVPQAPTATADTNTSQIATTEFVHTAISNHNVSTTSHNDIRDLITGLTNRLNALADSDDETLDQMSEIVTYIKANKSLIDSVTTTKINVSDIVDDLITNVTDKPLSASQGVIIKELIDTLQTEVNTKAKQSDLTKHTDDTVIHITAEERTNWTKAYTNTHSHSNKDVLDGITTELIEKWNKGSEDSGSGVVTGVTGIKGGAETDYRTGDVNITLENLIAKNSVINDDTNSSYRYPGNIDDLRWGKAGCYWIQTGVASGTHPFASGHYMLEVVCPNAGVIVQKAYTFDSSMTYYRMYTNSKWYDWSKGITEVTTTESGLMSASDKKKLDEKAEIEMYSNRFSQILASGEKLYVVSESTDDTVYCNGRGFKRNSSEKVLIVKRTNVNGQSSGYALVGATQDALDVTDVTTYGGLSGAYTWTTPLGNTVYIKSMGSWWINQEDPASEKHKVRVTVDGVEHIISNATMVNTYSSDSPFHQWILGIADIELFGKDINSFDPNHSSSGGGHIVSTTQPENTNLLWIDTSVSPAVMKYHNGESWISITTTAVWG